MAVRVLKGIVVSNKADKTISVAVESMVRHPKYHKSMRRTTKYHAHDEQNKYQKGDEVTIMECRPISKTKSWKVVEA
ncbi:MAG: 30S ribosomal protein S17 [Proteobacteria bacterium]|nr:30S ribosomal protein S17 [Pseudomonadota bacterium]